MRTKASPAEYLALLSVKYEVDPDPFFHALVSAEKNQKATCGNLSIECRDKKKDKITFLIQINSKVVAQFPISADFLQRQDNPIKDFAKTDMIRRHLERKNARLRTLPIRDLRSGMKQVNLKARVIEIPRPKLVFTRFGNYASVANALIADETGTVRLCLWNEQIDSIAAGDTIQVQNARMSMFRGERQLNIGKNGTISSIKDVNAQLIEVQNP